MNFFLLVQHTKSVSWKFFCTTLWSEKFCFDCSLQNIFVPLGLSGKIAFIFEAENYSFFKKSFSGFFFVVCFKLKFKKISQYLKSH